MAEVQILHEVGEYNLQQPDKLSEADQKKYQEESKTNPITEKSDK